MNHSKYQWASSKFLVDIGSLDANVLHNVRCSILVYRFSITINKYEKIIEKDTVSKNSWTNILSLINVQKRHSKC